MLRLPGERPGAPLIVGFACVMFFFFSSRRRHTRFKCDWSSDVCSSDLAFKAAAARIAAARLLPLVAGTSGFSELRAHAAANANFALARARRRLQIRQRKGAPRLRGRLRRLVLTALAGPSPAALTPFPHPLLHPFHAVPHLLDHAPHPPRVLAL